MTEFLIERIKISSYEQSETRVDIRLRMNYTVAVNIVMEA